MKHRTRRGIRPIQILPLGFLLIILLGSLLLTLPMSRADGVRLSFFDALFTSTSATCVTGLTVVTSSDFSAFGQIVLLLLMQVGGLGFMVMTAGLFLLVRKRTSLFERMTIAENFGESSLVGLRKLALSAMLYTFLTEAVGALLLCFRFVPLYGARGLWLSVFHSVSAFCNAGFDLFGTNSLLSFVGDPLVSLVIMGLIVAGGIGFGVVIDLGHVLFSRTPRPALHTKLVLSMTASLIVVGTGLTLLFEWNNPYTLGPLSFGEKLLAASFQSVTLRTAGFATIDQALLSEPSKLFGAIWMLFGGSPAGTAGGLKTTTFVVLFFAVLSSLRGQTETRLGRNALSNNLVVRALSILLLGTLLLLTSTLVIAVLEAPLGLSLLDILFEAASALCTVGLSVGVTAAVSNASRFVLILLMYVGRVGLVTFALSLTKPRKGSPLRYPEKNIPLG